jgi:hypothetical protein
MVSYIETSVQSVWRRQVESGADATVAPGRPVKALNRSTLAEKGAE